MSDLVMGSGAVVRTADALLRVAGGRLVKLRMPSPAVPGDATEQLGLATPQFQDVELGPVVFRKARATTGTVAAAGKAARYELIVSASAVAAMVGSLGFESVAVLFAQAAGVLVDETLLAIDTCTASQVGGVNYCYRLGVRGPVGLVV